MAFKFNPFSGSLDLISKSGGTYPEVDTFAELPDPTTVSGEIYTVKTNTGVIFINRAKKGLYISNGTSWEYLSSFVASEIPFNNTTSGLTASTVTDAINELKAKHTTDFEIVVKQASDLQNIDPTKVYIIDGKIDMGTQQIEVPSGGFFYRGHDYFVSCLFSTADNYTMFVNKSGENAGNVRGSNVEHYVSGTNSQMFNLDNQSNFGAIEFQSCNFGAFAAETTSLGTLSNYRQFRTSDFAFIRVADGLELIGTWVGGMLVSETIVLAPVSGSTLFKSGTGFIINDSIRSDINSLSIDNVTTIFDFAPANILLDWGFNLDGARFPIDSDPVPNMPLNSTKRYFRDSRGVKNTYVGGDWELTTQVQTTLSAGVLTKLEGNTTYNDLVHFSGVNDNEFVYDSTVPADCIVSGNIILDAGPNDEVDVVIRKFDDSTSTYSDVKTVKRVISNVVGGLDLAYFQIAAPVDLNQNDRIEVWVRNNTDATNATMAVGSFLRVDIR